VSAIVVIAVAGCTTASGGSSPARYLASLESSHRLDSRAAAVCTKSVGTPPRGTPIPKPLVAVNSSLKFVRTLESPSYLATTINSTLKSNQQGYAAICLFKMLNYGKPEKIWSYGLPNGDGGFINTP
jgi:hypothetical protein